MVILFGPRFRAALLSYMFVLSNARHRQRRVTQLRVTHHSYIFDRVNQLF
jgi:hypothetical protein